MNIFELKNYYDNLSWFKKLFFPSVLKDALPDIKNDHLLGVRSSFVCWYFNSRQQKYGFFGWFFREALNKFYHGDSQQKYMKLLSSTIIVKEEDRTSVLHAILGSKDPASKLIPLIEKLYAAGYTCDTSSSDRYLQKKLSPVIIKSIIESPNVDHLVEHMQHSNVKEMTYTEQILETVRLFPDYSKYHRRHLEILKPRPPATEEDAIEATIRLHAMPTAAQYRFWEIIANASTKKSNSEGLPHEMASEPRRASPI